MEVPTTSLTAEPIQHTGGAERLSIPVTYTAVSDKHMEHPR